jgi:ribose/xylose/arabinose/galactoside ABC-type transport system permease subunit
MTTVISAMTMVVHDRRVHAVVAVLAALAAGLLFGSDEAAAGFRYTA